MKYGVIYTETHYTPGDERSRTNPGHGYPESWDRIQKLETFKSKDELDTWVKNHYKAKQTWQDQKQDFTIIQYEEMALEVKVETTVKIS